MCSRRSNQVQTRTVSAASFLRVFWIPGRTCLVVAHRLATVQRCDVVAFLEATSSYLSQTRSPNRSSMPQHTVLCISTYELLLEQQCSFRTMLRSSSKLQGWSHPRARPSRGVLSKADASCGLQNGSLWVMCWSFTFHKRNQRF